MTARALAAMDALRSRYQREVLAAGVPPVTPAEATPAVAAVVEGEPATAVLSAAAQGSGGC